MEPFGVDELVYQGEIYDKMNNFSFDLEFFKKWCRHAAGPVLELCSGTGRLTIPLKKSGLDIMGLDMTDSMLEMAAKKAEKEGVQIDFVKGDMRAFDLKKKFSTIFIPFNSLQNTYTVSDVELIFENVKKHLLPGGVFLFDLFNPSIKLMVERGTSFKEGIRFRLEDGREVVVEEKCDYDSSTQVNRVKWLFKIGEEKHLQKVDMRCYYPLEIDAILKYNHFTVIEKFGSFDEKPFCSASQKQIFVCKVNGVA